MDYKKALIYALVFFLGFAIGKVLKIDIRTKGGCPIAQKKLQELRARLQSQSETSENYL